MQAKATAPQQAARPDSQVVRITDKGRAMLAAFEIQAKRRLAAAGKSTKQIGRGAVQGLDL